MCHGKRHSAYYKTQDEALAALSVIAANRAILDSGKCMLCGQANPSPPPSVDTTGPVSVPSPALTVDLIRDAVEHTLKVAIDEAP